MKLELSEKEIPYLRKRVANHDESFRFGKWPWILILAVGTSFLVTAIVKLYKSGEAEDVSKQLSQKTELSCRDMNDLKEYVDLQDDLSILHSKSFIEFVHDFMMASVLVFLGFLFWHKSRHEPIDIRIYRALLKEHDEKSSDAQTDLSAIRSGDR